MLYHLSELFPQSPLNVFRYVTFRSAGAAFTALFLSLWLGPHIIDWLQRLKLRQDYSDKAEDSSLTHKNTGKRGTPTMGGLLIVLAVDISVLLWARWNPFVLLTILTLVVFAALGFYDDWLKVTQQNNRGTHGRYKIFIQLALGIVICAYVWYRPETRNIISDIQIPFLKNAVLTGVPLLGSLLAVLAIVGSSNAVNLTDGMDGLAIGCTLIVGVVFAVLTYVAGHKIFASYLLVPFVSEAAELTVVCGGLIGASLGFLWFNCHPAQVFMGDTGSLAIGGMLGTISVLVHQPFILLIAGGVFVAEALSVILQVSYFKYSRRRFGTGRRIFKMSPLHHHYRELGWAESKIVTRFYIISILCAVAALSTLKLR
jgi:phospho-N-acetylmuramoyl-pentapeptide-transferase